MRTFRLALGLGLIMLMATVAQAQICCLDGQCQSLTRANCENAGGYYAGGSSCSSQNLCRFVGCCKLDGMCEPTTLVQCFYTDIGGLSFIEDETCPPGGCPLTGACCGHPYSLCQIMTEHDCTTVIQGVYQGDGSDCELCQVPEACCYQGTCEDVLPTICKATGRFAAGHGTDCATHYCPAPGDIDLDQDQDLTDFSLLTECFDGPDWGNESCFYEDLELDYDVDLYDVHLFLNAFSGAGSE